MRACMLVLLVGCGFRVEPPGSTTSGDAGLDGPGVVDAPGDDGQLPAACLEQWRAGTVQLTAPVQLASIGASQDDRDPFVSSDGLVMAFSSQRGGNTDIYMTVRAALDDPWSTPARVAVLSSAGVDSKVSSTADSLTVVLASDRSGTEGSSDLWLATRPNAGASFGSFTNGPFEDINDASAQLDPHISSDGLHIYYAHGVPQRIAVAHRSSLAADFGDVEVLIESGFGDADPSLPPDERIMLFASRRPGGQGGSDVWYTTRPDLNGAFATPVLVPVINSPSDDGDPTLTGDGCRLYFASSRVAGAGWELFESTVIR